MALIHKEAELTKKKDLILIISLVAGVSILYLANPLFGDYSSILTSVLYVAVTGYLCFISSRVLFNSKKYEQKIFVPILMFTISAFFIFAAEQTWIVYVEVLDEDPFPSIADIFYLATYPFLGLYLVYRLKTYGFKISKNVIFFVIGISSVVFIPTMLAAYDWNYEEDAFAFIIAMSYPLFDSALFGIAMIAFLYVFAKKQITQFWSLIIAGIMLWVIADTAWLFMEIEEIYFDGHPIDITWLVSYLLFGYAFTRRNQEITSKFYAPSPYQTYIETLNLAAITKIAIPITIITIVSVSTFLMIDYGLFESFIQGDHAQDITDLRYLIIGLMITFSIIIVALLRNTKGLMQLREVELKAEQREELSNERLATIGELGARLAHDLRNPLSLIKNNMLIIKKTSSDPNFNGRIEVQRINDAIARMSHQIENVLQFVKNREMAFSKINVKAIINSAIGIKSNNIKCEFPQEQVIVACDPLLLEIVFINLLSNAKSAMGESGNIIIRVKETDHVLIEFEDSGKGIPEENIDKIFEPLYTTKQQGTGLGLASCKNLIEKHGGTISVKNNPTTFTITLPKDR